MIISVYNDASGNNVQLTVDFDENFFPVKYTVSVNCSAEKFPGTKLGAEKAHKYYRNYVSVFEKMNPQEGRALHEPA